MANNPVWHNIFRYIVLKPDNITFEADNYKDTINIVRGPGVAWQGTTDLDIIGATGSDQFMINVDYDISIPLATTDLTLEDVNGNTSSVTFTAGRGVEILRNSAQELEWRSYSVTETDTLQTVTERNNITNNKIFVNDIEVGTISSSFTEDGFPSYDAGHNLIGDGTLDNPLRFSPLYQDSLIANNTDQFEFTALGPGVLAYSASYVFDTGATTGSVKLEREDPSSPGTWVVLDIVSGITQGYSYAIQGTYAELYSGNVNYRLTYSWTGNLGIITWHVQNTFEGGATTPILYPQLKTDTTAKTVDINDLQFFQNNIRTTVSNTDIVLDPAGTGRVRVLGDIEAQNIYVDGDITIGDGIGTDVLTINSQFTAGTQLKTTQSNGNTLNISAYDLNDAVYRDLIILTASNTPTLALTSNGVGSIDNITIGGSIAAAGTFTSLTATTAITFNTTTNNQSYTTTGAGTITITSGTTGSMNNVTIGNSTAAAGTFTSLTVTNNAVISPITIGSMNNVVIGSVTPAAGTFTSLTATNLSVTGSINLNEITVDGEIQIFDNVIQTTLSNSNLELRANGTGVVYIPDSLTVTNAITFNTTTNNQSYTTTGAGTITINSGTSGSINNMTIGNSTAAAGTFTTSTASQIVRSGAVSASAWSTTGVGIRSAANIFTDTSSPAGTIANAHINVLSQPTIAASNAITAVTNASTLYIANAPTNGTNVAAITNPYALYIAAGASYFNGSTTVNSTFTVNPAAAITMSPTGVGGTITMNPAGGGSLDNFNVGSTTRGSGAFTSLGANGAVTIQTTTNSQSYTTTGAGTITISSGTTGSINNMQIGNSTAASGAFTTLTTSTSIATTDSSTQAATTAWVRNNAGFAAQVIFTSGASTWTIPTGITKIKVTVVGAGGGGGGVSAVSGSGAGGGGGGISIAYYTGLTPGNTLNYSVGTGGTAGANTGGNGGNGGNTTVSSGTQTITTLQANGGQGGAGSNGGVATPGAGGAAGSGPAGAVLMSGYIGNTSASSALAGNGAGGPLGGGGGQGRVATTGAGSNATNFGAGGGGALGATANIGGTGSNGIVIIEY